VSVLGEAQSNIFVGNLHWLIQLLHTLVGIGAIVLAGYIGARYMALKHGAARQVAESQALR
jgi:hypothetical protein